MQQFIGTSLKTRLYLMVLASFIPVVVLILFVAEELKTIETKALLQKTLLLAEGAADTENKQMESVQNLLAVLTDALQVVGGQAARLGPLLANLPQQAGVYAVVGILDNQGTLMAGSDPSQMKASYATQDWFSASLEKQGMVMDRYQGDRIGGKPVLYFAQSVLDSQDQCHAVVFTALDLSRMNRSIFRQLAELPQGSRMTLWDQTQGMLRFDVDTGRWTVPKGLDADLQQQIVNHPSGARVAVDEGGTKRIYAFARMKSPLRPYGVSVVLEIPEAVALAASKRTFLRNLILLALSALTAVFCIWWIANAFILKRIGVIVKASRRLTAGDLRARTGRIGARDEINHLARVFDDMAASLQMRIEREEQVKASLERSRVQLRRLSAYQNEVREQERIRIAREIHDQLGQSLTVLKMDLSWLKKHMFESNDKMEEKMTAMAGMIETAMDSLHAVIAELRPVMLDDFGLAAAIDWQAEAFAQRSGIRCRFENNDFEPDLPKVQAIALFRILQETLTNILRHAKASEVVIRLEKHGDDLILRVADNGRGITADEINAPDAFGLLGIRERLYPFGGRVAFDGQSGQGTRVSIHLPMPQKGDAQ